ncbi:hypothetical protein COCSUDRAFT_40110 [Coccomyxa subellipsoidea C-169]|uniref:BZIP domain-containing protein n=1 Tax=Coccomyxa subellipsoidea (strain C-169) TaxID=574566 RepID=I0Z5E0_COCSC|nr:hypothetical protein COCSUDRAFT_40110 [Coccomyxa subellipsoidea C-169]EIE25859.1 hypothetical protein COCSUDRAFT_40110 [Coccomyxa subellipsoidea C-169]|eukprot:XP_005650403.1 hypothetical protein COCSUDRAFT_40110 [Coccomyxa subellipsoidea C-169]
MGSGYLGLDPVLPSVGIGAPLAYQPYTPFDNSATERQLADLFPNHLDMLNVPGLPQIDPYHAVFQEDPLFGPSVEEGQEGEEKPRSKMQEKNRRAQRRFRERQKTKFTELTGKVEELEGRLGELLSEKARLEDRTTILEHTLEMRRATSGETDDSLARRFSSVELSDTGASSSSPAGHVPSPLPHGALMAPGLSDDLAEGSVRFFHDELRLSLPFNGEHTLTLEDLKKTTPRDIICIYEQYVEELRSCLQVEAAHQPLTPAAVRVVKLANEISTLLLRAWALNPVAMRQMHQQLSAHAEERTPDARNEHRRIAACLRLTEEQREKLVAVTARFQHQRSTLLTQRQGIYARLQRPSDHVNVTQEAIDEFLRAHDAMKMLKINLCQEHWETLSYGSTATQLLTPWQMATLLVESYPQWYDFLALAEVLDEK